MARGPKFRVGQRHGLESSDLIVWIEHAPSAEMYARRGELLAAAGPDHFGEALACLDAGIAAFGAETELQLRAIEIV